MIEARIAASSLQDAVVAVEHFGLPGPVFCDICTGGCGAAHVFFLNQEIEDDELATMLQAAQIRGLPIVDAGNHIAPDGGRMFVSLDGLMILDEVN